MLPASDPSALRAFLEHPSRPAGTLTYHELQGFLFTIVSAPEMIPPSEWLPIIFAGEDIDYASVEEAEAVIGQIMTLSNTINASVLDPPTLLPADCPLQDDVLANFEDDAPMTGGPVASCTGTGGSRNSGRTCQKRWPRNWTPR